MSPGDAYSNSGQQAPFGLAVKSVGQVCGQPRQPPTRCIARRRLIPVLCFIHAHQTFETPDAKQTMITKFAFYLSRAQPAPRFIVPYIYKVSRAIGRCIGSVW